MYIGKDVNKRSIKFINIREGTVFTYSSGTYMRCTDNAAVDLSNGKIIYPTKENKDEWSECLIYPRASVQLGL